MELRFENSSISQAFSITRTVRAIVGVMEDYVRLRPAAPYVGRKKNRAPPRNHLVLGPPRSIHCSLPYTRTLRMYPINPAVTIAGPDEERIEAIRRLLPNNLTPQTYAQHWHTMLHVEEEQMK